MDFKLFSLSALAPIKTWDNLDPTTFQSLCVPGTVVTLTALLFWPKPKDGLRLKEKRRELCAHPVDTHHPAPRGGVLQPPQVELQLARGSFFELPQG